VVGNLELTERGFPNSNGWLRRKASGQQAPVRERNTQHCNRADESTPAFISSPSVGDLAHASSPKIRFSNFFSQDSLMFRVLEQATPCASRQLIGKARVDFSNERPPA